MAGGMHGRGHVWQGGCVWQVSMCGRGVCMAGVVHGRECAWWGHAWWGGMCGRGGHA